MHVFPSAHLSPGRQTGRRSSDTVGRQHCARNMLGGPRIPTIGCVPHGCRRTARPAADEFGIVGTGAGRIAIAIAIRWKWSTEDTSSTAVQLVGTFVRVRFAQLHLEHVGVGRNGTAGGVRTVGAAGPLARWTLAVDIVAAHVADDAVDKRLWCVVWS